MRQVSVKISVKILWVLLVMVLGSGAALAQFSSSIEGTVNDRLAPSSHPPKLS